MTLPASIIQQVYQHYQASEWCLITLDRHNNIIQVNAKAVNDLELKDSDSDIREVLPLLATESLKVPFYLPFYNHKNQVFDVHFFIEQDLKYLIMVPVDVIHQMVQKKQQLAHNEEIEKLKFKTLFETLEQAQDELMKANESKSFYISALSHEMGNPLNAIKGYNQLLQEDAITVEKACQIIDKNVNKLTEIIRQALDYDNKKSHQNCQVLSPYKIINELFNDFKLQAQKKSLKLVNKIDHQLTLRSNLTKCLQILTNLISNAIKYTDHGSITVTATVEDHQIFLDVADTGCGIGTEFQSNLFQSWTRENKHAAKGNGIGLVISRMLAEQLNGELMLHSSDDHGSVFRLILPVFKTVKSKHILLVDDDQDCLDLFNYYLSQNNHQVSLANSISALEEQLQSNFFDVIITDLNLGDSKVSELIDLITEKVKLKIVMTANPSNQTIENLYDLGFDQVLSKPLNQKDLVNSVA